ncbi:aminotransferase class I/II-fold pyridoxal phosphate-dependent enzyme [Bartonella tamiae]|uniref:aminotransferase class I/II-fold pyridoxal phosphate-dependent enzyme n=1 Tax=Bartonella tamiae TaxID=373638 RepID=UPI0006843EF1|nr:aminotransferase class I/II-fold pyridoxal phosphate-dependent enzyme [Bartonella tamiae]
MKGVLFASPNKPKGAIIPKEEMVATLDFCCLVHMQVTSDEIYHRLNIFTPDVTALSLDNTVIFANSFSKYYCMTGGRMN